MAYLGDYRYVWSSYENWSIVVDVHHRNIDHSRSTVTREMGEYM